MPRQKRFLIPNVPVHLVQRGRSKRNVFHRDADFTVYKAALLKAIAKTGCLLHAYVLMDNHVHLLITPPKEDALIRFMKVVGVRYVPFYHQVYGTSGSIWEGRYKSSLILNMNYFFSVMRYIEMNPVRAGMVDFPVQYRWSSYAGNVGLTEDELLSPHTLFDSLGASKQIFFEEYKRLFGSVTDHVYVDVIRSALRGSNNLGEEM